MTSAPTVRTKAKFDCVIFFRNNKSHKLCIHVRTGDFNEYHWESNPVATAEAVQRITQDYMKNETNYSLVFLGEDKGFFKQAPLTEQQMRNVIVTPHLHRGDEIFFGITACDSLLITAHMSSYAFWIGYLMPEESPIYYIANHNNSLHILPPMHDLPPAWVPLDLTIFTP
ncbi:galactoside 2-alpha-L-fucosyltransferase [Ditylenchus destructor]|nr:galactoside 2-alpha-L-fucosyltransferase [Ditylenchus destructor]